MSDATTRRYRLRLSDCIHLSVKSYNTVSIVFVHIIICIYIMSCLVQRSGAYIDTRECRMYKYNYTTLAYTCTCVVGIASTMNAVCSTHTALRPEGDIKRFQLHVHLVHTLYTYCINLSTHEALNFLYA